MKTRNNNIEYNAVECEENRIKKQWKIKYANQMEELNEICTRAKSNDRERKWGKKLRERKKQKHIEND